MTTLVIASGDAVVTIDPNNGGRVSSLLIRGTETVCGPGPGVDTFGWGIYPMVPFAGRLRDARIAHNGTTARLSVDAPPHGLHGVVHSTMWQVIDSSSTTATLRTDLQQPWPWRADLTHRLSLDDRGLRCEMTVTAKDTQPMMIGWHPWFRQPCAMSFEFGSMYERGADHLPTGRLVRPVSQNLDDCFTDPLTDPVVTIDGVALVLRSDCSHWVIYDGDPRGVCLEPQSGAPNSPNDSPTVLPAGQEMRRSFEITW